MRLRTYLIRMAIAVLAPVIISSVVALKMLRDAGHQASLDSLQSTARNISLVVDRELASSEAALYVLADSQYLKKGDLKAFYAMAATVDRNQDGWTILLDENGQQLINRAVPYGKPLPPSIAKARIDQVLKTGKPLISDVIFGPVTKRLVTSIDVPVYLPDGRKYVLVRAFNTDFFNHLILSVDTPPGLLIGLLDGKGNFIARNLNKEEMVGKPARPGLIEASRKSGASCHAKVTFCDLEHS